MRVAKLNQRVITDEVGVPNEFLCPILMERMVDPVTTADGFTYERSAIEEWFAKGQRTSPKTNLPLVSTQLRPNTALKALIDETIECDLGRFMETVVLDLIRGRAAAAAVAISPRPPLRMARRRSPPLRQLLRGRLPLRRCRRKRRATW